MSFSSHRSQSSQSNGSSNLHGRKQCRHGEADILTSKTIDNPCRRFYRCPNRKTLDCGLFEWIDPPLPEFQKSCYLRMKADKEDLEKQLKSKLGMEKMHTRDVKDENFDMVEELQSRVNELGVVAQKMQNSC